MSWNYTVHQINRSLEQIALWYQDFLRRSEAAFRALHDRITDLEQRQASLQGPSDEQVERVLRKILAERFGDGTILPVPETTQTQNRDVEYFVRPPNGASVPRAPLIDPGVLQVDPAAVPSKAYGQTFQMLEKGLHQYPQTEVTKSAVKETVVKDEERFKRPEMAPNNSRLW